MASSFDKFLKDKAKHAVAGSTKLLATMGGKHIVNIEAAADIDNGAIIGKGAFVDWEYYAEGECGAFSGVILGQAANGNWYVEVSEAQNAFLVLTVPVIYENYTKGLTDESNFYNAKGDIMRCYELAVNDIFELSAEGFSGTPVAGSTVSVSGKKVTVA